MTLHILPVSPWSGDAFERCCAALAAGDALLLLGDGVYAARAGASAAVALGIAGAVRIHVLGEDCAARGLDVMCAGVIITDYPGFVALAAEHDRSVTWL
jgi:tRNA 2-thiouridine synthesizing protein B